MGMETVADFRFSVSSVSRVRAAAQSGPARPYFLRVGTKFMVSKSWFQQRPSIYHMTLGNKKVGFVSKNHTAIKASMQPSDSGSSADPIAPLQLESPIGQFLSQILVSHPHLVHAAVEQQLEQLQTESDLEKQKEASSASCTELVLYRRIAEVKASERQKTLEEILYALVVQKFMDANVPLISSITSSPPRNSSRVDTWATQDEKLECLHSPEAYEMIQNHLTLILGNRLGDSNSVAQTSKLRVGQVYAASVMYGYFLKRVDQRFQLEKAMKILPRDINDEELSIQQVLAEETTRLSGESSDESMRNSQLLSEVSSWSSGIGTRGSSGIRTSRLRTYVMSFEGETLKRYATIRSKEAVSIVEKHTEALFGRPEIVITPQGTIDSSKDEIIKISFGGLRRLVLEAVTFGSFLWDVEGYVDSRFHFFTN